MLNRRLHVELLEDRQMLAIIADTFADSFAQVTRVTGQEATVLTADATGNAQIFYHPNDELGYIDPATGDLLFGEFFLSDTSSVFVLDATPNGNLSDLTGVTYSNGQVITPDGGLTVFHRDGSIMRSGGEWTYDAGAPLQSGGDWFWSNANALLTGSVAFHPNGAALRNGSTLYYGGGATFQNGAIINYPTSETLKSGDNYFYEDGEDLRIGNTLFHPTGGVMVEADGTVRNENGDLSFAPYTRTNTFATSEVRTDVSYVDSTTTLAITNDVDGAFGAYVTRFDLTYLELPPDPVDLKVTYVDETTLLFQWASGGSETTGYRVAWSEGVSAPGDVSTGVDVTDNYYVLTGLTPGQKVSVRVAARDVEDDLSYGSIATGTAGALVQTPQTGQLIASALDTTFAQVYDTIDKNIILTIDKDGNSIVWYYVNAELGYVNIDNGDRMQCFEYRMPWTNAIIPEVIDCDPIGNLSQIPSGATYQSGNLIRNGNTYYHDTPGNVVLRSASNTWFYPSGNTMKNASTTFWPASITMRSGTTFRYPNNNVLRNTTTLNYDNNTNFYTPTLSLYRNSVILKDSNSALNYQTGNSLYSSGTFRYSSSPTMIDMNGNPFTSAGTSAAYPFITSEALAASSVYIGINVDRIARYSLPVLSDTSVHVLGGNVDYSVALPPKPANLAVNSATTTSVTFDVTSGGGTTQDFVYDYVLGPEAPYISDNATPVVGNSFTIEGLTPGQQVAVRVWARNIEGELSPGITAVGQASSTPATGDFDGDGDVDGRDFLMWQRGGSPNPLSSDDLGLWQEEYGEEGGLSAVGSLLSAEEDWVPAFAGMTVVGRGNDVNENQYVEHVDRVFEQLNTSQTLLGKPAVAPAHGFGEMVARRGVARRFAVEPFETAL